jgi:tRNA nucleotidyltransferase (CCA-adding enzyme)
VLHSVGMRNRWRISEDFFILEHFSRFAIQNISIRGTRTPESEEDDNFVDNWGSRRKTEEPWIVDARKINRLSTAVEDENENPLNSIAFLIASIQSRLSIDSKRRNELKSLHIEEFNKGEIFF